MHTAHPELSVLQAGEPSASAAATRKQPTCGDVSFPAGHGEAAGGTYLR
jgi:hypothetical protein